MSRNYSEVRPTQLNRIRFDVCLHLIKNPSVVIYPAMTVCIAGCSQEYLKLVFTFSNKLGVMSRREASNIMRAVPITVNVLYYV